MFRKYLLAAILGVRSARLRSGLTVLGIAMGVFLVVTLIAVGRGIRYDVVSRVTDLGSEVVVVNSVNDQLDDRAADSPVSLADAFAIPRFTLDDVATVKEQQHVSIVAPARYIGGAVKVGGKTISPSAVIATTPEYTDIRDLKFSEGSFFTSQNQNQKMVPVILGSELKDQLFGKGPAVGRQLFHGQTEAVVIGVIDGGQSGEVGGTALSLIGPPNLIADPQQASLYTLILARVEGVEWVSSTRQDIEHALLAYRDGKTFTVSDAKELLRVSETILRVLTALVTLLAVISLTMSGVGIMNMMIVSVTDRTKEIGVRKTVGATARNIFWQFLFEAVVLTTIGAATGILLTIIGLQAINQLMPIKPIFGPELLLLGFALSTIVGVIFGVGPALRAARKEPIQALQTDHS